MNKQCSRDRLLEMVEGGLLCPHYVVFMFCDWNSRDDIIDMCEANEIELWTEEEEEEEEEEE